MAKIFTNAVLFNLCLLFISLFPASAQSPCDQTQVTLSSQAQVDSFPTQFCSTLCSLTIQGNDITNLDSLYVLESVATLKITFNPVLDDISGLANITGISGSCDARGLEISGNNLLSNVDGLSGITDITGGLTVSSNTMLVNLDGLSGLQTITTSVGSAGVNISSNASLEDVDGLSNITYIGGSMVISQNPALANLNGFVSVQTISGALIVGLNDAVTSLDGFASLKKIGGQLTIEQNSSLQNIRGLSNVENIGQFQASGQALSISYNDVLTSLDGLQQLDTIKGTTWIDGNAALLNLDGLSSLRSLGTDSYNSGIRISGNASLEDISGIGNIVEISGGRASYLEISNNESLTSVDLPSLKGVFGNLGGRLAIEDNDALVNLDGLSSLEYVRGGISARLSIKRNSSLQDIDGLSSLMRINTADSLVIADNENLGRFCGIFTIIQNKGVGCSSAPECYTPDRIRISGNERNPTVEEIEAEGPCDSDFTQPTNIVFSNVSSEGMRVRFNNASSFTSGYIVLMKTFGPSAPEDVPQDGTSYHVGQVIGSSSIVVHVSSDTTFYVSGLEPSIPYYFDIFSFRATGNGTDYLTVNPLEGHQSTVAQTQMAGTLTFTDVTHESVTVALDVEEGNYIALMKAFGYPSPNDVPVDGHQYSVGNTVGSSTIVVNIGNGSPFTVNGLMPGVTYYFDIYKYDGSSFVYEENPLKGSQQTETEDMRPYPNPFDVSTSIPFVVNEPEAAVSVAIYDVLGREVEVLTSGNFTTGRHEASWNGADRSGKRVNPGVYIYSVRTDAGVVTGRVSVR